jgi:hypothetical protein
VFCWPIIGSVPENTHLQPGTARRSMRRRPGSEVDRTDRPDNAVIPTGHLTFRINTLS